jgi:hypothetical protein
VAARANIATEIATYVSSLLIPDSCNATTARPPTPTRAMARSATLPPAPVRAVAELVASIGSVELM